MNRTQKPNKSLHYYNAPMEFAEKDIQEICDNENLNIVQIKVGLLFCLQGSFILNFFLRFSLRRTQK
jgi:hypothetical protein